MKKICKIITEKQAKEFYKNNHKIIIIKSKNRRNNFYFVDNHDIPKEFNKNIWTPMTVIGCPFEEFKNTYYDKNKYLGI